MLNVLDEFTYECLAIRVARRLKAIDVIDVLSDLFILRGIPGHIRSDNGPEFVAEAVQEWIRAVGTKTAYIERGSPWETATSRASTRVFATNSSTARYSTRHAKRKPSSRVGGVTTTVSGRTRPRCSCPRSPCGRLRYVKRLRRPRFMARKSNAQANVKDSRKGHTSCIVAS